MMRKAPVHPCRAAAAILLALLCHGVLIAVLARPASADTSPTVGRNSNFLRAGYQYGSVLGTNDFVKGDNAAGKPIDTFQMLRLEFGWQTGGAMDWHHLYNFPSFGLGINAGDYANDEELGKPTSLYGFFDWPVKRWNRNALVFGLGFGLTDNWVSFDERTNPYNVAIGAGRSVYIDAGLNYELALARRWWLQAGFSFTHYSNGGSQQPNWGINQLGGLLFVKYDLRERQLPATRRTIAPYEPRWELSTTLAMGVRNLAMDLRDDPEFSSYLTKDYAIGNFTVVAARQFSHMSRYNLGLDLEYDDSVADAVRLADLQAGAEPESVSAWDRLGLGVVGGYEHVVARAQLLVQLGYTVLRRDVTDQNGNEARVPRFYQRLGLRYHVLDDVYLGLNVRFHDFSRADNLEFNLGYRWWL
jgi:hypothetical protein